MRTSKKMRSDRSVATRFAKANQVVDILKKLIQSVQIATKSTTIRRLLEEKFCMMFIWKATR